MNKPQIQSYINNFRRRLAPFLRAGIGVQCSIYPAISGGAVLVFHLGPGTENDDVYKASNPSLGSALAKIEQRAYFSPSWTAFQADRGRDFSVIVDGVSV